jgi:polyisoprenoid-binding protein YceI
LIVPRWLRWLLVSVAVIVVLAGALAAYVWFSGGSGEPSTELVTPTVTTVPATAPGDSITYEIDQDQSLVRFILDEDLRGEPTRVVGVTDQVAAQIVVDFGDPQSSQLGTIRINARTLATDSEFRDRAIRGQILDSAQDEFEFIEFTPTAIGGFPTSVMPGDAVELEITGDLTIRTLTNPVTFAVTLTVDESQVSGSGTAVVQRADFELTIPNVPSVANVSEDVTLEIDFVALPVG